MEYKGFDLDISFDEDYPPPDQWLVAVNRIENRKYVCKWLRWFRTQDEGIRHAKAWIDAFLPYPIGEED